MMMTTYFLIGANILGLLTLLGLVSYTVQNSSKHTGMNPYFLLGVFIPLLILGFALYWQIQPHKWPAIVSIVIGLVGIVLLVYFDKADILLQYEVWIKRGMP